MKKKDIIAKRSYYSYNKPGGLFMDNNFFIVGGDMRNVYLANILAKNNKNVKIIGFDKIYNQNLLNNKIEKVHYINNEDNTTYISSIPLTLDEITIKAPFSEQKLYLEQLKNKKLVAGKIPEGIYGIDILKDESFTIKNVIPTVEGAIALAIEKTTKTLQDSKVLVLGYGRIGKLLSKKLKLLDCEVYTEARKEEDLTWIKANGYISVKLEEIDKVVEKMDIIFNTIPSLILDKNILNKVRKDTLIIDLATKPGGVDFEYAKENDIEAILYSGIPGKIAPESNAEYIYEFLKWKT